MDSGYFFHPTWPVLYEDNHLLVLYKPAGLLVQGDETREISLLDLAKTWIKKKYKKPGLVFLGMAHRIDRPVAGVVLFCRTSKAASRLSEQFRSGAVAKHYLAVVEGRLKKESGRLVHQIERRRNRSSRIVPEPMQGSQEARLSYKLLDSFETRSLVEIHLETGRHHQIRLQMADLGHPILGDLRYGASAPLPAAQIALLARKLAVVHPIRNEKILFQSPVPEGWPWPIRIDDSPSPPWNWSELQPLISSRAGRE
ncbi:MAG: RluA family pseudouridine synthase [Syntrophobacteraceae bacterium]